MAVFFMTRRSGFSVWTKKLYVLDEEGYGYNKSSMIFLALFSLIKT